MKKLIFIIVFCGFANAIFAGAAFFQDGGNNRYNKIVFDLGSGNEWKRADTEIEGQSYGTKYVSDTWKLKGAEGFVWKDNSSNITSMTLNYRVYKQGSTPPSFSTLDIPWASDLGGNEQRWAKDNYNVDLLSLVTESGTWVIEFYYSAATNGTNCSNPIYWNNGGNNYKLTFTSNIIQSSTAGDWNTGSNWHGSSVPGTSHSVRINNNMNVDIDAEIYALTIESGKVLTINATKSLKVTNTVTNNAGTSGLVVKSTSSGTGTLITNSAVSATVERYITGTGSNTHLVASPIASANFSTIWTSGDYNVYYYDESATGAKNNGWTRIVSGTLTNGRGYSVAYSANTTKSFAGTLNTAVSPTLTYTSSGGSSEDGWNMIGNPFPSAIDWDACTGKTNLNAAAAVWNGSAYIDWNGSTGSLTDGIIPAMQGFWIQTNAASPALTFPHSAKVVSTTGFYANQLNNHIVLSISNSDYTDKTYIHFRDEASADFDNQYDSYKLFGLPEVAQVYSKSKSGTELSINSLGLLAENTTIPIGFRCNKSGKYELELNGIFSFDNPVKVYLIDMLDQKFIEITEDSYKYVFHHDADDSELRFALAFRMSNSSLDENNIFVPAVFSKGNEITVINTNTLSKIKIYDIMGALITEKDCQPNTSATIMMEVAKGPYIVRIDSNEGIYTQKVIMQ